MDVHDRLDALIKALGKNSNSFSQEIGVSNTHIYYIVKGNKTLGGKKNKPSFDLLSKISETFPDVNLEWLVNGRGSMFHSFEDKQGTANEIESVEKEESIDFGYKVVETLEQEIQEYRKREKFHLETISTLSKR